MGRGLNVRRGTLWGGGVLGEDHFGEVEVGGGGDFEVMFVSIDEPDLFAGEFEELGVVGDGVEGEGAGGEGVEECGTAHDLWGLHGEECVSGDGALDGSGEGCEGLFDGEVDG